MAQHFKYWSCSKFADFIRGTSKPKAATLEGWDEWRKTVTDTNHIRYWIAEEGLGHLQDFVTWPIRKLYDIKYYINNRWVTKTHALSSKLKPGQWHEFDTRILHCLFDELVNFVEIEQASHHIAWDTEARKKYSAPWYASGWFKWRTWRSPEAGIGYLTWAATLTHNEWIDSSHDDWDKPSQQAIAAQETLALYHWWTQTYPARVDAMDASGWSDWCKINPVMKKANREQATVLLDKTSEIEAAYAAEDEEMLIRLIKLRSSLWT